MKHNKLNLIAVLCLLCGFAFAQTAQEAAVKKLIEPRLGENTKVDSVTKTPYSGLFEVRTGEDIVYTDEKAKYLFVGRVLDAKTYQDYTKDQTAATANASAIRCKRWITSRSTPLCIIF